MSCRFFAYCLLSNHFHLLMRTDSISLSRVMHFVLAAYARHFNLKFSRQGHVFENRFKSFPCTDDRYFLACLRYIHLNPVKAGIVQEPGEWKWSGHRELSDAIGGPLLDRERTLSVFGSDRQQARLDYLSFLGNVGDESEDELREPSPPLLSAPAMRENVLPSVQTLEEISFAVARETGFSLEEIRRKRRTRPISRARQLIALRSSDFGYPVTQVANFLNCSPSAVSQMLSRDLATRRVS